uniref:Uncharacterized protein n=1 Tax=Chenopodium quinoa TaxID=63459 RepID=A0A803LV46_CHEQI
MADAIATGVAVEAAKVAAKLVTARVLDEIKLACGFQDQLVKLQDKLSDIQALLEDLGSAKYIEKSKFVNLWPKKFTDLAYSADELMDDYEYELLRRKIELKNNHPSFKKKCSNYFSLVTNPAVFRVRMSHRVRETLSKFDELYKEAKKNEFIGRKSDEEKLLQIIGKDVDRLSTVAIVGIGGVGKTTIARRLYEHDGHFDKKIWICVSEDFKVDRLLNEMVEHLTSSKCDLTNTGALTNNLEQQLKGKKFFLVLDDVWENNQESWDSFRNALLSIGDLRGCVILITTRSIDVAEKARAFYQHKLPGLSEDEGWALLQQRVFSETRPYDSSFNNVGRRIVNKCKGVPLAIKAIGGTLQSKKHPYEWELIENSELWNCQPGDIIDILPSLMLSYNHLNHVYVKQCFAYCAIFPKDYEMEKHQLITLWLAQGFLPGEFATSSSTLTMEMIGENYFNILLNYSFLEEVKNSYGRIVYKMHDLVHDLAAYVSKKYLLVWKDRIKLEDDVSHVRHLVFDLSKNETPSETSTRRLLTRKLRTISFRDNVWINSTLGGARYIRTLIIFDTRLSKVPYIIGQFVHLRYLDLSHSNICKLPESICKFYQLQTLRIMGSGLMYLPRGLYRLENLRHIEASRFLSASGGLRQLTNLQTLPPLELRDGEGWSIDELGPLDQVKGQVNIKGLEHVKNKEAARQAGLGRKDKIVTLHLGWNPYREASHQVINDEDVLESLEPHPNLQSLSVDGFMGVSFPSWMMAMVVKHGGHSTPLTNLKEVTLTDCRKSQQLPTLGQLPFLRILRLEGFNDVECIGEAFYDVSGTAGEKVLFQSLSELHILSFERLITWMPPSPPIQVEILFPKIEKLNIEDCPKLKRITCLQFQSLKCLTLRNVDGTQPLDIIKYSPALQSLHAWKMEKMMTLPQELSNCTKLEELKVFDCEKLKCIPSGLTSLKDLTISNCRSLACIPDGLFSLCNLNVSDCEGLERMPKSLEESTPLVSIIIKDCPLIKGPIPDLGRLQKLENLRLVYSGELMACCLQWIPNLHRLERLQIGGYSREEWDFNLTFPQSLRGLTLSYFAKVKSLSQQLLPSTLQSLVIERFDELEQLPEWIGNLSSLRTLCLDNCNKLKYLPSKQLEGFNDVECIGEAFYNVNGSADEKVSFQSPSELHILGFRRLITWMPPSLPILERVP